MAREFHERFRNVQCAHCLLHGTSQVSTLAPSKHAAAYLAQQSPVRIFCQLQICFVVGLFGELTH